MGGDGSFGDAVRSGEAWGVYLYEVCRWTEGRMICLLVDHPLTYYNMQLGDTRCMHDMTFASALCVHMDGRVKWDV